MPLGMKQVPFVSGQRRFLGKEWKRRPEGETAKGGKRGQPMSEGARGTAPSWTLRALLMAFGGVPKRRKGGTDHKEGLPI
jgi:hypothetical protein